MSKSSPEPVASFRAGRMFTAVECQKCPHPNQPVNFGRNRNILVSVSFTPLLVDVAGEICLLGEVSTPRSANWPSVFTRPEDLIPQNRLIYL